MVGGVGGPSGHGGGIGETNQMRVLSALWERQAGRRSAQLGVGQQDTRSREKSLRLPVG